MLKFVYGEEYRTPCTLILGGFDGLHLGHRALLGRAEKYGDAVCITTMPGGKGKALFTLAEREFLFARAGVDAVCEIPLTEAVRQTSAEDFSGTLFSKLSARRVLCGEDFRFGRDALGTPALLKHLAPCPVETIPVIGAVHAGAEAPGMQKFSTSACKERLQRGELALLNACLCADGDFYGSAYFIGGAVEHGRQMGRTYGFPTLNLSVPKEKLLPPDGVYGGCAATPAGNFPCIVNIGARPTFGVAERKLEAFLDGFSGDLYGAEVRVYPTEFYRPIKKFSCAAALKEQLERDVQRLRSHRA